MHNLQVTTDWGRIHYQTYPEKVTDQIIMIQWKIKNEMGPFALRNVDGLVQERRLSCTNLSMSQAAGKFQYWYPDVTQRTALCWWYNHCIYIHGQCWYNPRHVYAEHWGSDHAELITQVSNHTFSIRIKVDGRPSSVISLSRIFKSSFHNIQWKNINHKFIDQFKIVYNSTVSCIKQQALKCQSHCNYDIIGTS